MIRAKWHAKIASICGGRCLNFSSWGSHGLCDAKSPVAVDWQGRAARYLQYLEDQITVQVLTSRWDEDTIWKLIQGLPADAGSEGLWSAVGQSKGFDELRHRLGVSKMALEEADAQLLALQEALRRKARVVPVCGREFGITRTI